MKVEGKKQGVRKTVSVGRAVIGSPELVLIADFSSKGQEDILKWSRFLRSRGVSLLKMDSFSGEADFLAVVRNEFGMAVITGVQEPSDVEQAVACCDMIKVSWEQVFNCSLIQAVGKSGLPVLLERGVATTCEELLGAAGVLQEEGSEGIVFCIREIRGFEFPVRNVLDLSAVPVLKTLAPYPVVVDPGSAAGNQDFVRAMARAAVAAGADGLLLEFSQLENLDLLLELRMVAKAVGKVVREAENDDGRERKYLVEVREGVANCDY
ncbi:MAG TPA: 3-deoxy-7-phosphoheptulonate synthase [Peptococcaceae bacterium]|nr:3-deoxy-7-phosphoheptulonate synthase [Peptococcaceae bacterium]